METFIDAPAMRTARRYIAREIYRSTAIILIALVGLFMFFSLIEGLDQVGERITLLNLFYLQSLDLPNHLYELLPIGLLIGAVLALAGLAQRHELTILRASGVSGLRLLATLWVITLPLVGGAYILSEYITPAAELQGSESRLALLGRSNGGRLASGYWFKEINPQGGSRIINIHSLGSHGRVSGIVLYDFGRDDTLHSYTQAKAGQFEQGRLNLTDLTETRIEPHATQALEGGQTPKGPIARLIHTPTLSIHTSLTPERLIARILTPENMSISDLLDYIHYLRANHLQADRQEVALWRKIAYPFTLLVMMTIAAPIGFMQTRRGGVGAKIFLGIILGVGFFMLNQLALNAGMLGNWPPWATALVPSLAGLMFALLALLAMEHRHHLSLWLRQRRLERGHS